LQANLHLQQLPNPCLASCPAVHGVPLPVVSPSCLTGCSCRGQARARPALTTTSSRLSLCTTTSPSSGGALLEVWSVTGGCRTCPATVSSGIGQPLCVHACPKPSVGTLSNCAHAFLRSPQWPGARRPGPRSLAALPDHPEARLPQAALPGGRWGGELLCLLSLGRKRN